MAHREELPHQTLETGRNLDQRNLESSRGQLEHNGTLTEIVNLPSSPSIANEPELSLQNITLEENGPNKAKESVDVNLPPGWEARKTPDGKVYYVDHNTKQTSWVLPSRVAADAVVSLPPGWEQRRNEEGRTYFVDHSTKTSTWVAPPQATTTPTLPPGWEQRRNDEGRIYFVDHNTQTSTWVSPQPVTTITPLPSGWEERRTAEGRVFYVNHDTKTTSWVPPPTTDKDQPLPSGPEAIQNVNLPSTTKSHPKSKEIASKDQQNRPSSIDEVESMFSRIAAQEAAARDFRNAYPLPETADKKSLGQEEAASPHNAAWLDDQKLDMFTYTPLTDSKGFIRLLYVEPAKLSGSILKCRLEAVPIEERSEYVALSYVWGKAVFDTAIVCNEKRFDITPNLSAALRQYRTTKRCTKNTPIWADAICINQADKTEVPAQISLMNRIYSQASEVFAYLGEAPAQWAATYELIYSLAQAHDHMLQDGAQGVKKAALSHSGDAQNKVPGTMDDAIRRYYSIPGRNDPCWEQFVKFSSSPWFVRTWIIQEVALARSLTLFYGRYPVSWNTFCTAFEFYTQLSRHFGYPHVTQRDPLGAWNSLGVRRLRNLCEVARPPVETSDTLVYFLTQTAAEFLATDPRDKVIGILGLLGEGLTLQRTTVLADPHNTVDQVYHSTAVHLVDLGAGRVMIRLAGLSRRNEAKQIPSWVPDWSAQTPEFGTTAMSRRFDDKFCAASHLQSQMYLEGRHEAKSPPSLSGPLPTKLIVSGAVIDTIEFVGRCTASHSTIFSSNAGDTGKSMTGQKSDLTANSSEYSHSYTTFKNWYSSARDGFKQACNSILVMPYGDVEEAFACTLIFNNVRDEKKHFGVFTSIHDVVKAHDELIATLSTDQDFHFSLEDFNATESYFMQALTCYQTRSFVVTKRGYMAMVPEASVQGDAVALFCGSPTLVILRDVKMEGAQIEAKLVGEAYVHGLMEGQLKDRRDELNLCEIALM